MPVRLWGSAGITLQPLAPVDVSAYLRRDAADPAAVARWAPVLATLGTDAPVAQALDSPLLVALARTIYNPRPGEHTGSLPDPAELSRLPTRVDVQQHLFDAFLRAAYRPHPNPAQRSRWTADQAERWLGFLAQHLRDDRDNTTDIAWWHLHHAIPRPLLGLGAGLPVGLAVGFGLTPQALAGRLPGGLPGGLAVGLAGGLTVGLAGGIFMAPTARSDVIPTRHLRWSTRGLAFGLVVGLAGGFAFGPAVGLAVGLIAVLGGGLGGGRWMIPTAQSDVIPARRLRWSARGLALGLATALIGGLIGGVAVGVAVGSRSAWRSGLSVPQPT